MKRVSAIALLSCAPLLLTQQALAQDCICAGQPTSTFGLETPDTTIESTLTTSDAPMPAPAAPVLWCSGGNDPRCMPMQPSDAPAFRALSGGPVAMGVDLVRAPLARVARVMTSMTPAEGLAPARGVVSSIERPPRR